MRVIPIDNIREIFDGLDGNQIGSFDNWVAQAESHLDSIRDMNPANRSKYWAKNNFWRELYPALSKLSGHKCWYSEAPENSSEWEIEHYRPKANSKNEDGLVLREDGYWWLSYSWKNFRFAGSLVNKQRRERFEKNIEVYGKGNYFPLEDVDSIAQPEDSDCDCERPMLLDPIKPRDVTLISFDKNGEPYPTYNEDDNPLFHKKAILSIKYYGLKHSPLNRGRTKVWANCETVVSKAHNYIKNNINDPIRRDEKIDDCYLQLAKFTRPGEPYTMVVRNYVKEKIKDDNYNWLADVGLVLGS
tara:strand:+ start:8392 stop:9294 length:903 start_codon:yes stop_codon:yes gene_type:complete